MAAPNASHYCGIDFGTSNSTVALATADEHFLATLEGAEPSLPSAIFFNATSGRVAFGRAAITDYLAGENGRFMRALKSVIGRPLFREKTRIERRDVTLADILSLYLRHLKTTAERQIGHEIDQVVLGRPVQFIEDSTDLDGQAQCDLEQAARQVGFKQIEFQFEPIAAALEYETSVGAEQIVLVADIGGGTSDFSIVRVAPEKINAPDRTKDILANRGVRVGGTDFDQQLSMKQVMPSLGAGSIYGAKNLEMPTWIYMDLSTWSNVNFVYERKIVAEIKTLRREARKPKLLERLLAVLEHQSGHRLIGDVERAKIALSDEDEALLDLAYIESALSFPVSQKDFETSIADLVRRVEDCIARTVIDAAVPAAKINTVFMTGGSSMARPIQSLIRRLFPAAEVISGDVFGAVGKGLGLDAKRKFA
ncbi:MAG TPA: Hsp70 family protein [Stellaceae bacterium]|jgi:hypothetical chaperone protein